MNDTQMRGTDGEVRAPLRRRYTRLIASHLLVAVVVAGLMHLNVTPGQQPLTQEVADLRERNVALEVELDDFAKKHVHLNRKHIDLGKKHGDLTRRYAVAAHNLSALQSRFGQLSRKHRSLTADHDRLVERHQKQTRAVMTMTAKLSDRTVRAAQRNVAGIFPASWPIFGTAATAAVTAWDVADFCQTLADLKALDEEVGGTEVAATAPSVCGARLPSKASLLTRAKATISRLPEAVRP